VKQQEEARNEIKDLRFQMSNLVRENEILRKKDIGNSGNSVGPGLGQGGAGAGVVDGSGHAGGILGADPGYGGGAGTGTGRGPATQDREKLSPRFPGGGSFLPSPSPTSLTPSSPGGGLKRPRRMEYEDEDYFYNTEMSSPMFW
jgi:hypothetical protein